MTFVDVAFELVFKLSNWANTIYCVHTAAETGVILWSAVVQTSGWTAVMIGKMGELPFLDKVKHNVSCSGRD